MEKPLQRPDRLLWNDQAPYIARFEQQVTEEQLRDQLMLLDCEVVARTYMMHAHHPRYGDYHTFTKPDQPYPDNRERKEYLENEIVFHKGPVALLTTGTLLPYRMVNGMLFAERSHPRTRLLVSEPLAKLLYDALERAYARK